jgi:formate--tetrahydrofolate ligase
MSNTLLPIHEVARKLGLPDKYFEQIGSESGKVWLKLLSDPAFKRRGKLIIVTATTPTPAGEGKTVTAISLTQGLAQGLLHQLLGLGIEHRDRLLPRV